LNVDGSTVQLGIALILATGTVVWRVSKLSSDLKKMITDLSERLAILETKTVDVSKDHDKVVLLESKVTAAHKRLDDIATA